MKTAGIVILVVGAWLMYTVVRSSADSSFGGINGGSWAHGQPVGPATPPSQLPPGPALPGPSNLPPGTFGGQGFFGGWADPANGPVI